jgi:ATP-dependent Clp protease ATP-binding subunit ClpX
MDGVALEFKEDALREVAQEAINRNTGARGLRAILEKVMLEVMYDIPSRTDIKKCVITKESILNQEPPLLITGQRSKKKQDSA